MDEYYYDSEENCRLVITKTWLEALDECESVRDEKAKIADQATTALYCAACLAALDIIIAAFLSML